MYKLEDFEIYQLTPSDFEEFQDWVVRLEPFHSDRISPPMKVDQFLLLFQICFGCKLPISKVTNLRKRDIDLRQKVVLTKKRSRLVKIPLRDKEYAELQKYLRRMSDAQKLFPITQNTARKYAENAMIMGDLVNPNRAPLNHDASYEMIIHDSRKINSRSKTKKETVRQKTIAKDTKRTLTPAQKTWVWENKSHKCIICKKQVKKMSEAHFDHIIPHTSGGKTTPANATITHALCNRLKGKKSLKQIQEELGTLSS